MFNFITKIYFLEKFVTEIQIPVGPSEGETGFRKKEKENEK